MEFEPEFTAKSKVPPGFAMRFWSESKGPRANVLSNTPMPPAGVVLIRVGLEVNSNLKAKMELPAVLLLSR